MNTEITETDTVILFDRHRGMSLPTGAVDADAGKIIGVSIATAGVVAEGHDLEIYDDAGNVQERRLWVTDDQTLKDMLAAIESIGEPLKAKVEHDTGIDEVVGHFENFRIDGDHLRADFTAFPTSRHAPHVLTLAGKIAKQFGVSVTAELRRVRAGAHDLMRVARVLSADFVDEPAINAGLFSRKKDVDFSHKRTQQKPSIPKTNTTMDEETKAEIQALISEMLEQSLTPIRESIQGAESRIEAVEGAITQPSEQPSQEMAAGETVAAEIQRLQDAGMTLAEIGAAVDRSESTISAIKSGEIETPPDELLEALRGITPPDPEREAMSAKLSAVESAVSQMTKRLEAAEAKAKALGLSLGATATPASAGGEGASDFGIELSKKQREGKPYHVAIRELNAEQPELVRAELSRRNLKNINLL